MAAGEAGLLQGLKARSHTAKPRASYRRKDEPGLGRHHCGLSSWTSPHGPRRCVWTIASPRPCPWLFLAVTTG